MQPARADILDTGVDLRREVGDRAHGVVAEIEGHVLRGQQRLVLLDQVGLGVGEDAHEVIARKRLQLDADRQAALQLRQQVRGLGQVERARGDEQDMVGLHRAMLGGDRGALDQGQQIALHAFATDIGAAHFGAPGDLVDLVQEHDAVVLHGADGLAGDALLVQKLVGFLAQQHLIGLGYRHLAGLGAPTHHAAQEVGEVDHAHLSAGHAGNVHGRHRGRHGFLHLHLDLAVIEGAFAQHLAEFLAGFRTRVIAHQGVEHALLGGQLGLGGDLLAQALPGHGEGDLGKVAHDAFHVAADVTHFRELGGFDLQERRIGELGEPARDLGLSNARGPHHQDVLGQHFVAQILRQLLAAPAVAQSHRDGALGVALADDVAVQFGDDLARGEGRAHRDSTVTSRLV